jgi:23S rRNA pseudouridine955/2504/2580 synthase
MQNSRETEAASVQYVEITSANDGQRIDNFLVTHLKGVPKSYIYRILRKGEVRVNKGRIKANYRLKAGDTVRIPPVRVSLKGDEIEIDGRHLERLEQSILYEDERILVLNKPSGMAVHSGSGLNFGVIEALRQLRPRETQLELAHRLDRETSGCLLISKSRESLRTLHELLRDNGVDKRYLALLSGKWRQDRIEVDAPLLKNILKGGERVVQVDHRGKPALTRFRVRERYPECTLVEVRLVTGRTHQIRVHSAHLGTPILGDVKYGDPEANKAMRNRGLKRLFLHAESIHLQWPEGGDVHVSAPLEPALCDFLKGLRK